MVDPATAMYPFKKVILQIVFKKEKAFDLEQKDSFLNCIMVFHFTIL